MKKRLVLSALTLTLVFLAGCAATTKQAASSQVKCPACGYQFEVPTPTP